MTVLSTISIQADDPLYDAFMQGVLTFYRLLESGKYIVRVATSFGKDSSVVGAMVLEAGRLAAANGIHHPPIIVSHADTGIENPEIMQLNRGEIAKVHEFCAKHRINYKFSLARPRLFEGYITRIVGLNKLPTYESGPAECSMAYKVKPQTRQAKEIANFVKKNFPKAELIVATGVRLDESAARRQHIMERGDSATAPFRTETGLSISPIMHWDEEMVFTFLQRGARYGCYSDFSRTWEVYAEASGGGCAVVGGLVTDEEKASRAGCGQRFGCALCNRTGKADKSMEAMLTLPKNEYMRELNALRNFIQSIRWDAGRRKYLGRTIDENDTVAVIADTFDGQTAQQLLRMLCSIQKAENEAAGALGIAPRFSLMTAEQILAIDVQWSRYGTAPAFSAWVIAREVFEEGKTLFPSAVVLDAPENKPVGFNTHHGRIKVSEPANGFSPLRNVLTESLNEGRCIGVRAMKVGRTDLVVSELEIAESYRVDPEGLALFMDFELDRMIEQYHRADVNPTAAVKMYFQFGFLSSSIKGILENDRIISNTDRLWHSGLLSLSRDELIALADKTLVHPLVAKDPAQSKKSNKGAMVNEFSQWEQFDLFAELV